MSSRPPSAAIDAEGVQPGYDLIPTKSGDRLRSVKSGDTTRLIHPDVELKFGILRRGETRGHGNGINNIQYNPGVTAVDTTVDAIDYPLVQSRMMKTITTICGIILFGAMLSCSATDRNAETVSPAPIRDKKVYSRAEVGMTISEFRSLCLPRGMTAKDSIREGSSASGKIVWITLADDLKATGTWRNERDCTGLFTFRDGVLEGHTGFEY
jgi:hypothetical protein